MLSQMKKIFSLVLLTFLFLLSKETNAQKLSPPQQKQLNTLYKTKKVVYFKFKVNSMQEVKQMANIIKVDKVKGTDVSAHATKEQFTRFLPYNYKYTVIAGGGAAKKTSPAKKVVKKK